MKLRIQIQPEGGQPREHETDGPYCLVGRKNVNVIVEDGRCSGQHLMFFEGEDGELWVRDLGSTNGSYVLTRKITELPMKIGDIVRIGRTDITVLAFTPGQEVPATAPQIDRTPDPDDVTQKTKSMITIGKKGSRDKLLTNKWPDNLYAHPDKVKKNFQEYLKPKDAVQQLDPQQVSKKNRKPG